MTDFTPSPELVEAAAAAFPTYGTDEDCVLECLPAAAAYRNKNGDPELVPWEQVRELVDAAQRVLREDGHALWRAEADIAAALAPFTQEPQP